MPSIGLPALVKLHKARAGLVQDQPFFGTLALRLRLVEDSSCETAWTDGTSMGYNPLFIDTLSLDEAKFLFCHEVGHVAYLHHTRRLGREPGRWNRAGDYVLNGMILKSTSYSMPKGGLLNPAFDGFATEAVYDRLPDDGTTQSSQGKPSDKPQKGQGKSKGKSGKKSGSGQGEPIQNPSDPGRCGEVRDAPGQSTPPASPADLELAESDWKVAVAQAASVARAAGKLPAGLERIVAEILEPVVDWKSITREFMERTAKADYDWGVPNRRHISRGFMLPSLRSKELKPFVLVVDVSGSVTQERLDVFDAEANGVLEEHPTTPCHVIYCDSAVSKVDEYEGGERIKLKAVGGGGTDFRPAFAEVEKLGITPSCLIYLTDMECSDFPKEAPEYPVLWARLEKDDKGTKPPWGEEVIISQEKERFIRG
jgi:predicted metal-dependent peptidase